MGDRTCQVFTPEELVQNMLEIVGYKKNIVGKKILENSCGEGAFLVEIVARYIRDARNWAIPEWNIRLGLERDIIGIEKDGKLCQKCILKLNEVTEEFGIKDVKWNITQKDALSVLTEGRYDYVVGNPPYITYYNLTIDERVQIKNIFASCKNGKPDYYYAFTEAAIRSLAPGGRMAYLIPNNFMKNRFSEELRQYLLPHILALYDYRDEKLFRGRLTSSAILVCQKDSKKPYFHYLDVPAGQRKRIDKRKLAGKWVFGLNYEGNDVTRFGDFFQVSAPVATLLNKAFVFEDVMEESDKYIFFKDHYIEKAALRKGASPRTKQREREKTNTYIIFPYYYVDGKRFSYEEEEYCKRFPQAYTYLKRQKKALLDRKSDDKCQWFEYGRTQALAHINQEKILLSTIITEQVRFYRLSADVVPYSGMYIVPRQGHSLEEAERILKSEDFLRYVKEVGINVSGSSYRISPRDVAGYVLRGASV